MLEPRTPEIDDLEPVVPLSTAVIVLVITGLVTATVALLFERSLPGLYASIFGPQPQAYWDLARSSGIVAYLLLWLSVVFGLLVTNRMGRNWLGVQNMIDLHQFTS